MPESRAMRHSFSILVQTTTSLPLAGWARMRSSTRLSWKSSWIPPVTVVVSPGVAHFRMVFPATPFIDSMHSLCTFIMRCASAVDFRGIGIIGVLLVGLDCEMFLDQCRIEVVNCAGCDDPSVIDHQKSVAEPTRHLDMLFRQQKRDAELLVQRQQRVANLMDDIRLDTLGWFIEQQHLGTDGERACDRELLLLPAGQQAGAPVQVGFQVGEQPKADFGDVRNAV